MSSRRLGEWWIVALLTVPWLNPYATGPMPNMWPWLVSAMCAILLCLQRHKLCVGLIVFSWVLAAIVSAAIGLLQYFGLVQALHPWVSQSQMGEAFANLRQRNQFASLTNIALASLVWLVVAHGFSPRRQWLVWAAAGLLAAGNAASSSRTGLLQLVLLCVTCFLWAGLHQSPVRRVLLVAVLFYGTATLALPWLVGTDLQGHGMVARLRGGDSVCASRLTLWSNVFHLIGQKPWLGWGWGELDYAHYMTLYPGGRFCDILDNAHNLPLHFAVELGIPVALLLCGSAAWIVWRGQPWFERDTTRQMVWVVLAIILLHSMLEYPLWYGPFQMTFALCLWLLWPAHRKQGMTSAVGLQTVHTIRVAVVAVIFPVIAYAAWDYHRISQIYLAPQARDAAYRDNTLEKIRESRIFKNQVRFAELTTTPLTRSNAEWTFQTAGELLHFSPEPRIIEKVIESAVMLGRDDEAMFHLVRYRAAFPAEHAKWRLLNTLDEQGTN